MVVATTVQIPATLPEIFAPERSAQVSSFADAHAACEQWFHYERQDSALAQLFLDDDLTLRVAGEQYQLTERAFDDLCRIVTVPVRFAKDIPTDLAATIGNRLARFQQQAVVIIRRDDTIVGLIDPAKWTHTRAKTHRPSFLPVSNRQVLHLSEKLWSAAEAPPRITLSDAGVSVALLDPRSTVEPRVGDVTQVGTVITSSETGGPMLQARGYTLRLICSNGAVVPQSFGLLRFNTDWRVQLSLRLQTFAQQLQAFALDLQALRTAYGQLAAAPLTDQLFYNLYRQTAHVFRRTPNPERLADAALGVPTEHRQEIVGQVRQRQQEQRGLSGSSLQPPRVIAVSAWEIFNNLTGTARGEPLPRRVALERLAGDLLQVGPPAP